MAFRPINWDEGVVIHVPATASEAFTKGAALVYTSGAVTAATGGQGGPIFAVAAETKTIGSAVDSLAVWPVFGTSILWEADTDAVWSLADVGTYADLASASTVDPDASADDLFLIYSGVGTAEVDTKVIGTFKNFAVES